MIFTMIAIFVVLVAVLGIVGYRTMKGRK